MRPARLLSVPGCALWLALAAAAPPASRAAQATAWPADAPADAIALDFAQARQRLLQVSDALAAADANVRGKGELSQATRSLRLPDLSVEVRRMELQKSLTLPLGSLAPVAEDYGIESPLKFVDRKWYTRPVLTATMPLYSGGQIPAAQQAAAAAERQAAAERDGQAQSLATQLVQAYFGQQLAEYALAVRRDVRDGMQRHLDDAGKLEREGFATRAQRLQATVARDKAEREYRKALDDLDSARAALAVLLHQDRPARPTSRLFVSSAPAAPRPAFLAAALERHPQIQRLRAMTDQAEQGVRVQQARFKPVVYAFGQYDMNRDNALITDPDWAFGIGLKYTFLSSADRSRQISAAREQQAQAEAGLREAGNQIEIGVTQSWNALETARTQFLLLDSSIEQARENLRLQELGFREGQSTSLDVIDARLALGGAQVERAQAAYQYDLALARLLEISGQADRFDDYLRKADRTVSP